MLAKWAIYYIQTKIYQEGEYYLDADPSKMWKKSLNTSWFIAKNVFLQKWTYMEKYLQLGQFF